MLMQQVRSAHMDGGLHRPSMRRFFALRSAVGADIKLPQGRQGDL
jgi:hypothetical protein